MKKSAWIWLAVLVLVLVILGGLKLSGVDLMKGGSFSVGGAAADNGAASYSGKNLTVTVDAAQNWTLTQSSSCVTLDENMPTIKDGKASYTFTAASDGDGTLTFTGDDGENLTAIFTVEGASIKHVQLK